MTSTVKRSVPPPALVKMGNPLVRMLLGSPLHGGLDDSFLVLHLKGRKTGCRYDIPVGYVDMEGKLTVVTVARWRVNLRGGADVEVTLASPNADLPTILSMHHFMIVADGTTDFSSGNGTGAFTCKQFTPGERSIGVMLSGMGADGEEAMLELRRRGARNLAQDEASCVVFGMPKQAIAMGGVHEILPLAAIARRLVELSIANG